VPRSQLIALRSRLIAPQNQLIALRSQLIAPQNQLIALRSQLIAPQNQLIASQRRLIVPRSQLIASHNRSADPKQDVDRQLIQAFVGQTLLCEFTSVEGQAFDSFPLGGSVGTKRLGEVRRDGLNFSQQ